MHTCVPGCALVDVDACRPSLSGAPTGAVGLLVLEGRACLIYPTWSHRGLEARRPPRGGARWHMEVRVPWEARPAPGAL